jgi:hypothetical protein
VQQHRQDDLAVAGQGLQVAGAQLAAGLGRHDPAVRVGGVALGDVSLVRVGQRALQRRGGAFLLVVVQNSATSPELGFYAARSYSLMRPPRTGRRVIRSWERSATG